jgi:hypothetical protein
MFNTLVRKTIRSAMKLDPAVIKLLHLDPDSTTVSSAGGGGCSSASTTKITSRLNDGTEKCFFMKTGSGEAASVMFKGADAVLLDSVGTAADRHRRRTCLS